MNAPSNVPVVTIFVRHSAACKYKGDVFCRRCNCRKHLRWTAGGVQYRRSAKARTWAEAERQKQYLIEEMSAGNAPATPTVAPTIQSLVEAFVTSKQSQRIGDTTVKRHKRELSRLVDFLGENGVFVPNAITAAALYKFRATWKNALPGQQYAAGSATAHPPVPALPPRRWILAEVAPVKPHQSGPAYTGVRLRGTSDAATAEYLAEELDGFSDNPTFTRSFAYRTGPAYGILLDMLNADWRKSLSPQSDFSKLVSDAIGFQLPQNVVDEADRRALDYDGESAGNAARS